MLYSKNGSIPKPQTDGTDGWIEVPDEPATPDGKEVVWWYPPGWVIRDKSPGKDYSWHQSKEQWIKQNPTVTNDLVVDVSISNETVTLSDTIIGSTSLDMAK